MPYHNAADDGGIMTMEIQTKWPLLVPAPLEEKALQKPVSISSNKVQASIVKEKEVQPISRAYWEKGLFIDIYA